MSTNAYLFDAGHVVRTPGALIAIVNSGVSEWSLLERHRRCDFGDVSPAEWASNEQALINGGPMFSAYPMVGGATLWIITEPYWKMTTLLLPHEYSARFPEGLSERRETARLAAIDAARASLNASRSDATLVAP